MRRSEADLWDALEAVTYALALLADPAVHTAKARAARRPSRKHPGTSRACAPLDRRATQWTAVGALEAGADGRAGPAVLACELIAGMWGRPLSLIEELSAFQYGEFVVGAVGGSGRAGALAALEGLRRWLEYRLGLRDRRLKQLQLFPVEAKCRTPAVGAAGDTCSPEAPPTARSGVRRVA